MSAEPAHVSAPPGGMRRLEPADVTITVDGVSAPARSGETVAAALAVAGRPLVYCGMGACFTCLVLVDGRCVRACLEPVRGGIRVETECRG